MKKIILGLLCLSAVYSTGVFAFEVGLDPYIGLDMQYGRELFDNQYKGSDFKKWSPVGNAYVGVQFHRNFAMEFGYMQSQRTKRTMNLNVGDYILNHQIVNGEEGNHKLELKSRAFHLNLVGFYPMTDKLDLIGSVGIDWLNVIAYYTNAGNEIHDMKSKKAILDLGVGVKYMVNEKFGARAMVNWQNKSKLSNLNYTNGEPYTAKIKNSFKFGLGVFFYPI